MIMVTDTRRIFATPAALGMIASLIREHGPIMFHQSGACCDGSSPICCPQTDFLIGAGDVLLGAIGGAPFYVGSASPAYWQHAQLIIDIVDGRGSIMSLDYGRGRRFITRTRFFTDEEEAMLEECVPA